MFLRSQALLFEPKVSPKWDPNHIFDAEAFRKPLGGFLERSWRLVELRRQSWNHSWSALEVCWDPVAKTPGSRIPMEP